MAGQQALHGFGGKDGVLQDALNLVQRLLRHRARGLARGGGQVELEALTATAVGQGGQPAEGRLDAFLCVVAGAKLEPEHATGIGFRRGGALVGVEGGQGALAHAGHAADGPAAAFALALAFASANDGHVRRPLLNGSREMLAQGAEFVKTADGAIGQVGAGHLRALPAQGNSAKVEQVKGDGVVANGAEHVHVDFVAVAHRHRSLELAGE